MISITVNGENVLVKPQSVLDYIKNEKNLDPAHVVIEYNLAILHKNTWAETILKDKDRIEIVNFVGGG